MKWQTIRDEGPTRQRCGPYTVLPYKTPDGKRWFFAYYCPQGVIADMIGCRIATAEEARDVCKEHWKSNNSRAA